MRYEKISLTAEDKSIFMDAYLADPVGGKARKALLVIPGGGYGGLACDREGEPIAMAFLPHGYNAFVLHYTVGLKKPFPAQLIESSLAIKYIKDHAANLGIDPDEVFTVGFSAGGHLAACTGVLWKHPAIYEAVDMPYGYNKPKGTMLIYPVLSTDWHDISFANLWCTATPTQEQLDAVSIEKLVDADSAPAFILHTADDQVVDVKNSLTLAWALSNVGHRFELHIYPHAPHGVALGNDLTDCGNPDWNDPAIAKWVDHAAYWAERL